MPQRDSAQEDYCGVLHTGQFLIVCTVAECPPWPLRHSPSIFHSLHAKCINCDFVLADATRRSRVLHVASVLYLYSFDSFLFVKEPLRVSC